MWAGFHPAYTGKPAKEDGYLTLKKMGIRTIINLRSHHGEKEAAEDAGLRYLNFLSAYFIR
jgi:hypothetical protein